MNGRCYFQVTCFACFSMFICAVTSHSMNDSKKLLNDRMLTYEKTFRPVENQSEPIEVYIGFELVSIQEFKEVKEQQTVAAIIRAHWIDEYMTWDPTDYGGLDQLVIESDNVWTPNLVLLNTVEKLKKIGDSWQLIRFLPDGFAYYFPGDVFSATCQVDVTYYPWDRHKCSFSFAPWAQSETEIIFSPIGDKVFTTYFSENGIWHFYNSSIGHTPGSFFIDFTLYLKRKPVFVLLNVVLPIIFMAFLNTLVFAIPVESGERISYSITVLLALAVFLTFVGDNLPKTSSPMSLFGYYLLIVLIISISITLTTIFNMRLYHKDENIPIPDWIVPFVMCLKCECRNIKNKRKCRSLENKKETMDTENEHRSKNENAVDSFNGRKAELEHKNDSKILWRDVGSAFDKIFFVFYFITVSVATIWFFIKVSGNNENDVHD
ncbi:acetylcholine receptor subunit alpha-1-A-like [Ruditapes philippinarum]|uniref:acetylcholine receptor subunit alpha-1-A-like n=1 Tax=Ruditapes philippinarum TaxID=129788 RepID=UPI00295BB6C7|nr:acetylcholine receptor subunit alpha-1-A-like [Ruditapes philippinarum]